MNNYDWLKHSDSITYEFTHELGKILPERASEYGLAEYDSEATEWSLDTEQTYFSFLKSWQRRLTSQTVLAHNKNLSVDLRILKNFVDTALNGEKLHRDTVPFFEASQIIYQNLFTLLNPQTTVNRKNKAPSRFKKSLPSLAAWEQITRKKIAKATSRTIWPSRHTVEEYLQNSKLYASAIAEMLSETDCHCPQDILKFQEQIAVYDNFVRTEILPRARENPILPRSQYLQKLRENGVDVAPEKLIEWALADYNALLPELRSLAQEIGENRGLPADQRTPFYVSQKLRADHVKGADALLALTKKAAAFVEQIIKTHNLVTLPSDPISIRLSTPVENAVSPYVHVQTAPPLGKHQQRPQYIFPITEEETALDEDSHYWAAAVTLAAHEGRPGHELQFTRLLTEGSRMRATFGATNVNAEGWAVYVEHLLSPYLDVEARYGALQSILFRIARGYLDPMVQAGTVDERGVMTILVKELGMAESFAAGEYSRYLWRSPGQATSYYYGMRSLLELKDNLRRKKGEEFSELWFHDAFLSAGPMPFKLCEELLLTK